jgi:4'-phosphopantetheinyl transferase EntD
MVPSVIKIVAQPALESFFPEVMTCGGLSFRLRVGEQRRIALVDLDLLQEEVAETLLSDAEQDYAQRFRHPKRRREWLGGRMAAKAALLTLREPGEFQRLTVLPNEHGRPTVSGLTERGLSLSITHSGRYAAALAARGMSCGLDLQKISDSLPALTDYFASPAELRLLADQLDIGSHEARLTMLWTMKEAVKKSMFSDQPAIFSGIALERITVAQEQAWILDCVVQGCPPQRVIAYNFSPYVLALTLQ